MKKLIVITGLVLLLVGLVGCSPVQSQVKPVQPDQATGNKPSTGQTQPKQFKVGEAVQFDDLVITVHGAKVKKQDNNGLKPQKAKLVYVDVTIENKSTKPAQISSVMNFKLSEADGTQDNVTIVSDMNGQLDGELGPGRKMKGQVVFDVNDSQYYELIFENPFTQGQAIWKLENLK